MTIFTVFAEKWCRSTSRIKSRLRMPKQLTHPEIPFFPSFCEKIQQEDECDSDSPDHD